jgi:hypothetical protein
VPDVSAVYREGAVVTRSDLYPSEPAPLSRRVIEYYRHVMETHADDPVIEACLVCMTSRCQDWHSVRERLICAGDLDEKP